MSYQELHVAERFLDTRRSLELTLPQVTLHKIIGGTICEPLDSKERVEVIPSRQSKLFKTQVKVPTPHVWSRDVMHCERCHISPPASNSVVN